MSLKPSLIEAVPFETVRVARAAFPKGNLYLSMRDDSVFCLKMPTLQDFFRVAVSPRSLLGDWL